MRNKKKTKKKIQIKNESVLFVQRTLSLTLYSQKLGLSTNQINCIFHREIKVINFAVQLHFLILMIIVVCQENSMLIILIIKIKTANQIIRKRGEISNFFYEKKKKNNNKYFHKSGTTLKYIHNLKHPSNKSTDRSTFVNFTEKH